MDDTLIWILAGIVILLVLIPFLLGMMISPHQQATRVELIKAPIEDVWLALSELSRQIEWRTDLKGVQMKDDDDGMRWVEQATRGGTLVLRKMKEVHQKELVIQLEKGKQVRGTRQATFIKVPGGTRVTFTETSVTKNPLARLGAQVGSKLDKRLNHYISQFKTKFSVQ